MRGAFHAAPAPAAKPTRPAKKLAAVGKLAKETEVPPDSVPALARKLSKRHGGAVADVAAAEYELRTFLRAFWLDQGWSDRSHAADFARPARIGLTAFPPSVPQTGSGNGWGADRYAGILSNLEALQKRASAGPQQNATTALFAYALLHAGRDDEAVMILHETKFIESLEIEELRSPSSSEDYDVVLLILGFVVYGMANERLHHNDPQAGYAPFAYAGYARAIDLYDGVRGTVKAKSVDEMDRWGELALYRNTLFSVREGDTQSSLNAVRAYQTHAVRWPTSFNPTQRAVVYRTYLEALNRSVAQRGYLPPPATPEPGHHDPRSEIYQSKVIQTVAARVPILASADASIRPGSTGLCIVSRTTSTRRPRRSSTMRPGSLLWADEAYTISTALSPIIARSSDFPHAGQTNLLALELADALMTSWKLSGQEGGFVADDLVQVCALDPTFLADGSLTTLQALYAITRITFDSHLISRSLMEALTVAEQYGEAERALSLYVELVEKAREAAEAERQNARKTEDDAQSEASAASAASVNKFDDNDDSETYARALIYGAHLLEKTCKYAGADKLARQALKVLETDTQLAAPPEDAEADERLAHAELVAYIKRGAGVARAALAASQTESAPRDTMHKEALALLTESAKADNQAAETFYHLARLQGQLHDIPAATASARKAVELEPAAIEPWHLLALLLSCKKDYKAALRLASVALDAADKDASHDAGVSEREAAAAEADVHEVLDTVELRTELLSYDFPPSTTERDQAVLELLITHNALEELVAGTAAAIDGQKDIFLYFHNHIASDATQQLGKTKKGTLPKLALPDEALQIDTHPPSYFHRRGSRFASLLHHGPGFKGESKLSREDHEADAYSTITGLGQSGTKVAPASAVVMGTGDVASSAAAPPPVAVDAGSVAVSQRKTGHSPATIVRLTQRSQAEGKLLARLWLMSAATFRRAGQLADCRVAIQEAERIVPDLAGVWTQLALYHSENDRLTPATNCLYKSLTCDPQSVSAAVHLARMLLSRPDDMLVASSNVTPSGAGSTAPLSRSIAVPQKGASEFVVPAGVKIAPETQPTAYAVAEALLKAATAGPGWDVPEAWLYLGHVARQTKRPERAVEYLKYALWLEQAKPVRAFEDALSITLA